MKATGQLRPLQRATNGTVHMRDQSFLHYVHELMASSLVLAENCARLPVSCGKNCFSNRTNPSSVANWSSAGC